MDDYCVSHCGIMEYLLQTLVETAPNGCFVWVGALSSVWINTKFSLDVHYIYIYRESQTLDRTSIG